MPELENHTDTTLTLTERIPGQHIAVRETDLPPGESVAIHSLAETVELR